VHFCWVDLARHASFAAAFDVATSPSAFVLSTKKLRYAPLRIAFSTDAVTSLVDDVLAGRVSTVALSALPRLVDAGSAASVDPEPPAEEVEEEFDLSDIMGVDVDDSGSREARLCEAEQALKREAAERAAAAQEAAAAAKEEAARAAKAKKKKRKTAKKQEL
jgi:type IV secretory pathway VirB10-like protein